MTEINKLNIVQGNSPPLLHLIQQQHKDSIAQNIQGKLIYETYE